MFQRWRVLPGLLAAVLAGAPMGGAAAAAKGSEEPLRLKVGDAAPDFSLLSFDGAKVKKVSLADYRGKKSVALAFYVFAFTGG
jgi:AhpC/TSA family protein